MTSPVLNQNSAIFLDRDGTLMREVNYCSDPRQVALFPGVPQALARLKEGGFKLIVVTNQSGIGRGYFSIEEYEAVQREVDRQIGPGVIDATYYSPDLPGSQSLRRKPSPEMVFEAARAYSLDLNSSFFVGDKAIDVECGRNAGLRTILVQTGYGLAQGDCQPDYLALDMVEAAEIALRAAKGAP